MPVPSQTFSTNISVLRLVLVKVGATPPDHFTAAGQVTARAVPSQVKAKVKPYAPVGIFEKVMLVIAAFKLTANTLPKAQFKANTPDAIVGAVLTSFNPVIVGVVIAGLVPSKTAPVPLLEVTPVPPDATARVADKDAADPEVFWFKVGKVQLVKVPEVGVPRIGVISVGLVERTLAPEPVEVVTPVPPDATARVADNDAALPEVF